MTSQPDGARLRDLLTESLSRARELLAALRDEHEALETRTADAIDATLARKIERLDAFERLEKQREGLFRDMGIAHDGEALRARLAAAGLTVLWHELLETASACRDQNARNGALVEASRRHVQRALALLQGTPGTPTYGPDGNAKTDSSGPHTLVKA